MRRRTGPSVAMVVGGIILLLAIPRDPWPVGMYILLFLCSIAGSIIGHLLIRGHLVGFLLSVVIACFFFFAIAVADVYSRGSQAVTVYLMWMPLVIILIGLNGLAATLTVFPIIGSMISGEMRIVERVKRHPLTAFFLITLSISWLLWWFPWWFAEMLQPTRGGSGILGFRFFLSQIGEYSPALTGLIILSLLDPIASGRKWHTILAVFVPVFFLAAVMSLFTEDDIFRNTPLIVASVGVVALVVGVFSPLNRSFKTTFSPISIELTGTIWLVLSVLLLPVVILVTRILEILTYHLLGHEALIIAQHGSWDEIGKYIIALFSITLLYGGPLGEELGFRGFALPYLQKRHSPLAASVILGFFWALWHAPLDISRALRLTGLDSLFAYVEFFCRLIFVIPLTLLFTFFYNRTKGSILIAILVHTSANFAFELSQFQTLPTYGFLAVFVMVLVLDCYAIFSGRMWQKLPASVKS